MSSNFLSELKLIKIHLHLSDIHNFKKIPAVLCSQAELASCNSAGEEYQADDVEYFKEPEELIGKSLYFKIKIIRAQGLPNKFTVRVSIYYLSHYHLYKTIFYEFKLQTLSMKNLHNRKTIDKLMFPEKG